MTREPIEQTNDMPDDALRARLRDAAPDVPRASLDAMFADISSDVARADARPLAGLRAQSTTIRRLIGVASFIGIFCFAMLTSARPDLALYPLARLVAECAAYATLLFLSVFVAVRSEAMPLVPRSRIALLIAGGLAATVVLAMMPAPHTLPIHLVGHGSPSFIGSSSPCMYVGLALGIPVYVVLRLVDRGSPLASVLAASAAGLLANLVLQVHCPVTSVGHRLVGHASIGPILLCCLGAALLFERFVVAKTVR